ncbi:Plasmodium exported protein, unknown function [Plasmodium knowlesi strain H]|uniref:Plasmodium RESA N-terminal domain-containing protein n=3 Tax=Plasmodium knowlesi TaxID=5850 RepID=A0A5K1TUH9_PLAKH|nr:Plasmodium exported protein (PHIST), unknown function [Plasmodium knowlesi strain H]OTN64211.1 Uncharacterized protein PKNOH_S140253800 [Plasmodium knowlesi]CAA9990955.1 Plasmodium exported protein (PHIST), unknown function [Plasmodium knowlesi strain H]SBO20821.1 Plasmodium exported protein, unknown function [Plasmodium knowlesi strain H]SBO21244.1 Plasmodium exported protein, unknown function [Plasmodium knowlesi strain H]VVS80429.1 Plasmodium exported protein (PHIST), unknown function [P|eukprot:XP_002262238.1 hypothetical protein, conserved in Plasmodium species [Plasmodium knowlesi strain H]
MAHTNEIIINGASSRSMQSQCGNYQIVTARQERKMDERKSTQRSSFFTKRTAMLFFVVACIFLKHQDDARRQGVNASLQVHNKVGRNLSSKEEATPSGPNDHRLGQTEDHSEGGRQASPAVGEMEYPNVRQDVQKPAEQEAPLFGERTNYITDGDSGNYAIFESLCKNSFNDNKKKKKGKKEIEEEKKKEEALLKEKEKSQNKLSIGNTKVYSGPLAALEKYEDELEEERKRSLRYDKEERRKNKEREEYEKIEKWGMDKKVVVENDDNYLEQISEKRKRSLRYDEEEHIDDEEEMNELLFGEFKKWENYGTHTIPSSHYEVLCFEDRLNDYEINKELNEMEEMPKKCELVSLYWQSFMNEKRKYINANKRLFKKFLELKKKQNFDTMGKCNNKWKKCSKIVGTNFKEQREYVNDVFYSHMTKENLSKDEFKEILGHVRDSWKELTLKVTQECAALLEEPIVPDVKILDYDPYYGHGYFKVTRMSSPEVSS